MQPISPGEVKGITKIISASLHNLWRGLGIFRDLIPLTSGRWNLVGMQHIAQIVATFSHIPGANGRGKRIMTCNKGGGRCCKAKRHLDFFGRQPVSRGKFPGRKSWKGITAQKSITRFLGCYEDADQNTRKCSSVSSSDTKNSTPLHDGRDNQTDDMAQIWEENII